MLNETELAEIKCITLTGENVVISAAHFDALLSTVRELQRQVERETLTETELQEIEKTLDSLVHHAKVVERYSHPSLQPLSDTDWIICNSSHKQLALIRANLLSTVRELQRQVQEKEQDAKRLAYLYSGSPTASNALVNIELRMLDGEVPSMDEVRAAIDEAMSAPEEQTP